MNTRFEHSAGGVVLRPGPTGPEVVLASRRTMSGGLAWGLPKGLVEPGEDPEATAVREVREETGIVARIRRHIDDISYWFVWGGDRVKKKVSFFLMDAVGGDTAEHDHEMEEVLWFPLSSAPREATYRSEQQVLRKAAELYDADPVGR